ncbi:hypothetical protein LOK49_LG08G00762 [Camellia lanceoleosa]|uniref:Uncharacterized protein n=1 Tax=Camellia lanceoleosa TaxID=1840588 RepID=A0ACC0GQC3_9ERIC|nr:hypothetical protein LOK49_LG08G00762 [Camellia lanceoleosa]
MNMPNGKCGGEGWRKPEETSTDEAKGNRLERVAKRKPLERIAKGKRSERVTESISYRVGAAGNVNNFHQCSI